MNTSVYNEVVRTLRIISKADPRKTANYRAALSLSTELQDAYGWSRKSASQISQDVEMLLPDRLSNDEIDALTHPLAKIINNLQNAFIEDGFTYDSLIGLGRDMELKFE